MNKINVLDHGFVKLLNIAGATPDGDLDRNAAECARICFNNFEEERTKEQDLKLTEYLIKNKHTSPLEMTQIWIEMKLPIFVARQFVRHRTVSINEVSARYSILPEEWYIPEVVGGKPTNGMKQGQENSLESETQEYFRQALNKACIQDYKNYLTAIEQGVAPEHARMFLHLNHFTHWVWSQNLHNMMHFLSLRLDSHAQIEAQAYANAIYKLLFKRIPETMKLFDKYRRLK